MSVAKSNGRAGGSRARRGAAVKVPARRTRAVKKTASARHASGIRRPRHGRVPERISAAFDHFDTNKSGFLDYKELRHALKHYGLDVDTDGAKAVVAAYDDQPDGKLDLNEFEELVRTSRMERLLPYGGGGVYRNHSRCPGVVRAPRAATARPSAAARAATAAVVAAATGQGGVRVTSVR